MPIKTALKLIMLFLIFAIFSTTLVRFSTPVFSGEVEQIEGSIADKEKELESQKSKLSQIESRIADIANSNYSLAEKISLINTEITTLQAEIDSKNLEIDIKLKEIEEKQLLLKTKKEIMDNISGRLYMQTRYNGGDFFFSVSNFDEMLQNIFIKRSALNILRDDIEKINGEFTNLADAKAGLEKEKTDLDEQKKSLDDSYTLLATEKAKLQAELNAQNASKRSVSSKINGLSAELSDLQYQLIIARQGGTNVNLDSVPTSSDYNSSLAGFRANAPNGSFGVFAIGAYTHRNGMSQWGAKARAEAGQNYQQILNAYYVGSPIRTDGTIVRKSTGVVEGITTNIITTTYGTLNLEDDYLLRLNEVPESWPMEVLKAQAIAARTYAINYTDNGRGTICTTESCQVVGAGQKTGAWKTAVQATGVWF
jgi:peptidoglycan hydrolase CwlO-like protein